MLHIKILILVMIYQTYLPNMLKIIIKVIVWESKAIQNIFLIEMCNEILICDQNKEICDCWNIQQLQSFY